MTASDRDWLASDDDGTIACNQQRLRFSMLPKQTGFRPGSESVDSGRQPPPKPEAAPLQLPPDPVFLQISIRQRCWPRAHSLLVLVLLVALAAGLALAGSTLKSELAAISVPPENRKAPIDFRGGFARSLSEMRQEFRAAFAASTPPAVQTPNPKAPAGQVAGPLTVSANPNYFMDANGTVLILNGSQTWNTLQEWGSNGSVQPQDFSAFVSFLTAHGHNFTLLWRTELPKFCGLPSTTGSPPELTVSPHPWLRTGPGKATDGGLRFDLTKFDRTFFDRLRARSQALNSAGIYAGIYLFTGEWLNSFRCSSDGYPFTKANNVNGIDDGYSGGHAGTGSITMTAPNAITAFQDAYVEKVIDTLNDLPNVLWIVSEEAPGDSLWWNNHQISHIRAYESGKTRQHLIGFAALVGSSDAALYNSDADWIAPEVRVSPNKSCGTGKPACKVNVNDSDHTYWGMWNETALQNRNYAWENFMSGNQVLFMDPYLLFYPRENRNLCVSPTHAICSQPDTRWEDFRNNLGYILRYSRKVNLANLAPRGDLSSTGFCLAQTPSAGAEYLIYAPSGAPFTVNLSAMPDSKTLSVEWFNPSSGKVITGKSIPAGSASHWFHPPFSRDAVLYLADVKGHALSGNR